MKFFSLLAVLILPAASAISAKEVTEATFESLLSEDRTVYFASFADDYELRINFGAIDWEMQGTRTLGVDGFTLKDGFLPAFNKLKIYQLNYQVYQDATDNNKGHYDATIILKDQSGQRWRMSYICHFGINDEGVLTHGYHDYYKLEKLDAASIMNAWLKDWTCGKMDDFFANVADNYVHDFSSFGGNHASYSGVYHGLAGLKEVMVKQAAILSMEIGSNGCANVGVELLDLSNDGRRATYMLSGSLTILADGHEYYEKNLVTYSFNDVGQMVHMVAKDVESFDVTPPPASQKEL